jgi:signal transduction histidine kinase
MADAADSAALVLEIQDDGVGFDPTGEFPGHMGLTTMAERVQQIGGTLEIISAPHRGTTVRAAVPGAIRQ